MSLHVVNVTIQGKTITVDLDPVRIHDQSTIQWVGNEPFSITFKETGPFGARLSHSQAQEPRKPNQGWHGRYKYTIISDQDSSIVLDPIVIVDPGPTKP